MFNRPLRGVLILSLLSACGGGKKAPQTTATPAVTAVGEVQGEGVTVTIGPAGGAASSADGKLELIVPPGALAADTALSVTPLSVTAPGGVRAYRLGPEGTTFATPATVRFSFTDADIAGSAKEALRVAFQDEQRQWRSLDARTVEVDGVAVMTTHLSDWSLTLGYQLRPASANVRLRATQNLTVRYCDLVTKDAAGNDLELVGLVAPCEEGETVEPLLGAWAVNGVKGGSAATGTVRPGAPGVYTAPDKTPNPSIVAVSVEFTPPHPGERKTLLVSNLSIGGELPRTYSGMLTYHLKMGGPSTSILPFEYTMTAQLSLTRSPDSDSSYELTSSTARLTQVSRDTDLSCHCAGMDFSGALEPDSFDLSLDEETSTVDWFQFGALFENVALTCTPVTSSCGAELPAPELVVWALTGTNPACTATVEVGFDDPKQLTGSWRVSCPANPQVEGRVEETTWALQGAD